MIYPYKESKRLVMKNFFNSISCLIFAKFSGRRRQVCVACHCFINFLSLGYRPLSDRIKSNFRHYYQRCPSFQHQPPRAGKHCSHCDSHGGIIGIRLCVGKRDGIFLSHLERLLRKPERLLATILIANNFVNVTIVLLLNFALTQIMEFHSAALDFVFQSVILTFMLLLFGEILPKLYSNERRMKWVCSAVGPLSTLSRLLSPLTAVMARSTVIVNKVVTKRNEELSLDDLSHALEVTKVEGNNDKNMLEEILKFGGKTVSDIMTPRVDMTCVDWDASFDELLDMVRESGYSRMPVYVDTQDNIKGILASKTQASSGNSCCALPFSYRKAE